MRIVFAAVPAPGHLNPLLAIARLARARGDEVAVVTGRAPDPDQPHRAFERIFVDTMPAQADTLRRVIADEAPDLVVVDNLFLGALPLLLGPESRPSIVACGVTILTLDRADGASTGLGLPPARDAAERGRYRAIRAGVDAAFTAPVQAHADAVLAGMGLPPLGMPLMHACVLNCDAHLAGTVPEFEFDVGPVPAHVSFVGALPPPPALGGLPDGRDDLLVPATTGGRPTEALGPAVPANARVAPFLPFAPLFAPARPRVRALVINGGYGTVQLAPRAGVPIMVTGLTEDKAEVGARVAASGAGIDLQTDAPTLDESRASVEAVLTDLFCRERARAFAGSFAAHDTEREVLSALDRVVAARRAAPDPRKRWTWH